MQRSLRAPYLLVWFSLVASVASAQPAPQTLSVTVSGGASLGSYEGGYLYYLEETLERNPAAVRLQIGTGTSAGSTNALLVLLATCRPSVPRPEDSPFFTTWSRSNFERLFVPEHVDALGMFSRTVLSEVWDEQEALFERGLPVGCDLLLGVPATRLEAFEIPLRGALGGLARSEETFVVRITGRGEGRPPSVENYVDRARAYAPAFLPVDGDVPHEFRAVRDLVFASSSFPLAFSPYPLAHCIGAEEDENAAACRPENATHALFADGGVLDNTPLRLASMMARTGLVPDRAPVAGAVFRDAPDITERELPARTHFLYLDPDITAYPFEPPPDESTRADSGAIETFTRFGANVIDGARARELSALLEDYPEMRDRVRVSHAYVPQMGDLLYGFFALFDQQFRDFDFMLGMLDAERFVKAELTSALRTHASDETITLTEPDVNEESPVFRAFACARAFLHGVGDPEALCRGDDLVATRALLQLSIERLHLRCSTLPEGSRTTHAHCRRAMAGEPVPRVPHLPEPGAREARRRGESAIEHAVRRLDAMGFVFRGLGLRRGQGSRALLAMRERLGAMGGRFVAEQPSGRQVLDVVLRYAMNELVYTPPRVIGHVAIGRHIEVGASLGSPFGRVRWLRGTAALSIVGTETLIASGPTRMAFGGALGLEMEPLPLSSATFQLRLGGRLGYALGTADGAGREPCDDNDLARFCSRPYVDTYVAFSVAEAVRLSLSAFFYPAWGEGRELSFFIGPSIGVQLRSRE